VEKKAARATDGEETEETGKERRGEEDKSAS